MAKMYMLCDGNGAFTPDLEGDGCGRSRRVGASSHRVGKPGGLRTRDLVPPGLGLFGGFPCANLPYLLLPRAASLRSFQTGRCHGCLKGLANTSAGDVPSGRLLCLLSSLFLRKIKV